MVGQWNDPERTADTVAEFCRDQLDTVFSSVPAVLHAGRGSDGIPDHPSQKAPLVTRRVPRSRHRHIVALDCEIATEAREDTEMTITRDDDLRRRGLQQTLAEVERDRHRRRHPTRHRPRHRHKDRCPLNRRPESDRLDLSLRCRPSRNRRDSSPGRMWSAAGSGPLRSAHPLDQRQADLERCRVNAITHDRVGVTDSGRDQPHACFVATDHVAFQFDGAARLPHSRRSASRTRTWVDGG